MGSLATRAEGTQMVAARPQDDFRALLKAQWPRIQSVMPKAMKPERLMQLAISAYNTTPKLAECSTASILSCVMKCAALGLEPSAVDGLGRAYIIPYWDKKRHRLNAQMIVGYKGMIDLARRSGQLKSIHAQAVYEGDDFSYWDDDSGQHFTFSPKPGVPHTRDTLTYVYVSAHLMDGGFVFECMTRDEVEQIRARSKSPDKGPWATDYEAMALKTVIRRSFRYLPVSVEAQEAAAADETTPDYSSVLSPVIATEPTGDDSSHLDEGTGVHAQHADEMAENAPLSVDELVPDDEESAEITKGE